jgi:molybdate transport system permease protein
LASSNRFSIGSAAASGGALLLALPLLLLIVLAIAAIFIGTPLSDVFGQLHDDIAREAVLLSLKTTAITLAAIVLFGTGLAICIHRAPPWLAGAMEVMVTLPAIMPPSVAGIALLLAFGRQGLLGSTFDALGIRIAFTTVAVIMAQVFVATPFYVREVATALNGVDRNMLEAARIDGAGPARLARSIIFPLIMPFVVSGAVLSWARSVGEFGATILFAGSLPGVTQTVPLAIYLGFETDLGRAKALAVLLMLCAIVVLLLVRLLLRKQMKFAH